MRSNMTNKYTVFIRVLAEVSASSEESASQIGDDIAKEIAETSDTGRSTYLIYDVGVRKAVLSSLLPIED